ncbi:hypothetical protein [Nocardia asiatica]|uniref:hypothetical protein n=1 Tax=Nocardia asiatica TaxID=209252 RepID=UPI002458313F|nr:hypothetical protein [Nocardia asiatica]
MSIVSAGVGLVAGLFWLWCVVIVLDSRLSTDPVEDPHGYKLIFGTVSSLPAAITTAITLPFAFPRERRAHATQVATAILLLTTIGLFVALFTA